jgi:hypothetical protein
MLAVLGLLLSAVGANAADPFRIEIVDTSNGWPVPLVELETVHGVKFVSDNAGLIAFDALELMGTETWCSVRGFGYGIPKDGFGSEGIRFTPRPGGQLRVQVERRIIAKRLGRITGGGIFSESQKLGEETDWPESGIVGCDSVQNAVLDGRLFWLWGDTSLARYPLGIFDGTAASTPLRPLDRFEPPIRLRLDYYRDATGAPKPIATMDGTGPTWVTGVARIPDAAGVARLVGTFMKIKPPMDASKAGLCVWDADAERFSELKTVWEHSEKEPRRQPLLEGHPVAWQDAAEKTWLLFGNPFPAIRCPATFEAWSDPRTWESLEPPQFTGADSPVLIFEATFTRQFADTPAPVARYDYNQVLYRLDLDDAALEPARMNGDHGTGE